MASSVVHLQRTDCRCESLRTKTGVSTQTRPNCHSRGLILIGFDEVLSNAKLLVHRRTLVALILPYVILAPMWAYLSSSGQDVSIAGPVLTVIMCVIAGASVATLRLALKWQSWSTVRWLGSVVRSSIYAFAALLALLVYIASIKPMLDFRPTALGVLSVAVEVPLGVAVFGFVCASWVDGISAVWVRVRKMPIRLAARTVLALVVMTVGSEVVQWVASVVPVGFVEQLVYTLLFIWVPITWAVAMVSPDSKTLCVRQP